MSTAGRLTVILDMDGKRFANGIKLAEGKAKSFSKRVMAFMNRIKYAVMGVTASVLLLGRAFTTAAATAEGYRVALGKILRSQAEANRLFQDMSKYASTVSLEYKDIMSATTTLAGIMVGGADEVRKWMPVVGDLAAYAQNLGVTLPETTTQIIRFFSSGAAAADLFREKGINALLGFKAGVSYSVDETKKKLMEAWTDPLSKFQGMAEEMLKTWRGKVSLLKDAWFQFQVTFMEGGMLEYLKDMLDTTTGLVKKLGEIARTQIASPDQKLLGAMRRMQTAEQAFNEMRTTRKVRVVTPKAALRFPGAPFATKKGMSEDDYLDALEKKLKAQSEYREMLKGGLPSLPKPTPTGYPTGFDTSGFGKTRMRGELAPGKFDLAMALGGTGTLGQDFTGPGGTRAGRIDLSGILNPIIHIDQCITFSLCFSILF